MVAYPEAAVPLDLREQVVAMKDRAWPTGEPPDPAPWLDPSLDPPSVLLVDGDGRVLSALDILSKELTHLGVAYAASGISAMVTDERARGRGHGRRLAVAARELMAERDVDLGIFTCDRPLLGFYASAGWEHLPEPCSSAGPRSGRSRATGSTR